MRNVLAAFFAPLFFMPLPAFADDYEKVHPCDEYAAHPNDPNRWAKGVADEEIIPGPALQACREAADDYPDVPRFQFQLGRSLWAAHKLEDGLKVFLALEEKSEYGPVYAYLGDAYMNGIGGAETDQELAVSLYQIADEAGFSPASDVLAALKGDQPPETAEAVQDTPVQAETQEVAVQQQQPSPVTGEKPFDASIFVEKDIMDGLNSGMFEKVNKGTNEYLGSDSSLAYLSGFIEQFSENVNFRDQSCVNIHDPSLATALNYKLAQNVPGIGGIMFGGQGDLESNMNAGAEQGFKILGEMFKGLQNGQGMYGGLVQQTNNIAVLKGSGETDGTRLIMQHGCQSQVVRRIYANAAAYVTGRPGIPSPEEQQRRIQAQAETERQAAQAKQQQLRTAANKSCVGQFKKEAYCGCIIEGLNTSNIAEDEWQKLGGSFKEIIAIGSKYDGLSDRIKECRGRG